MPESQFSRASKIDDQALIRLVFAFAQGLSIPAAARTAEVTEKTARQHYIALRDRLLKPKFNQWHGLHRTLPDVAATEEELVLKSQFLTVLAACYGNATCYRNYTAGNRKSRLCSSCPIGAVWVDQERIEEALSLVDVVHAFYKLLHIRGEKRTEPTVLFMKRLVHTVSVTTARANSKALPGGMFLPTDQTPLSVGVLLDTLLTELAENPL
ncbi:hypothetical protein [Thalassobaculum litoreum]|uniref:Uncharacterized protein n=1 Tax=Thalassobaculum litoreum DSM 18839 TaxID=1123362 RepID=A0A8G2BM86_9PROT|nr:hypothetical protein [Thalassobaculum litoreum]SDG51006.1 hypothetical protein SAMN05660686_04671 [Thalassobaculum litoreum DSM 18839]